MKYENGWEAYTVKKEKIAVRIGVALVCLMCNNHDECENYLYY